MKRFWDKVDKSGACWEWTAYKMPSGYGMAYFDDRMQTSHRVAWQLTHGPIPEHDSYHGMCVCHTCDNRGCVNPDHLFLGTQVENLADRDNKGRAANTAGVKNPQAKLTEEDIVWIRGLGAPVEQIARCFEMSLSQIYKIRAGSSWS